MYVLVMGFGSFVLDARTNKQRGGCESGCDLGFFLFLLFEWEEEK